MMEERVVHFGYRMTSFYRRGVGVVWGFECLGAWVASGGLRGEHVPRSFVWLLLLMAPSPLFNVNVHNCWRFSDVKKDR